MMHSDHMIAQCGWRSVFDQQTKAVELQNFISRWSNTVLLDELDQYFTRICPATQTWRIETLHLDLGDIELEDLPAELPKRLQASLHEAFGRLLMQQRLSISSAYRDAYGNYTGNNSINTNSNLQILDHSISLHDFVSWFLLNGNLPWWYKGSASAVQILIKQIDECPQATLDIIRTLGQADVVRRRLVWQAGEPVVRKLVHLLEPWQGDFICGYADNLFKVQVQGQLPTDNATEFRQHTWFTILTYLLVDRGTLFNTIAFVRATLWQTAQRYQIDYQQLLAQLSSAVVALERMGLVTQVFLTAIVTISQQDHISKKEPIISEQVPIDYWMLMQQMLHYGRAWQTVQQDNLYQETVRIDELFTALANDDSERMASLLRQEGKSENVRKKLLQHFSLTELALVVRVVAPQDHLFILAHVEQTQPLVNQQAGDQKILWQVLLAYLFVDRGSYFNRRQFVYDTLMSVCNLQQLNYHVFLDLLINSVVQHPNGHRFELLAILQDLKADVDRRQTVTDERHLYWIAIRHYLTTGEQSASRDIALITENYPVLFYRLINNTSGFSHATAINSTAFAVLMRTPELASITNELLGQRLLQLIRPTDLRVLLMAIQPEASEFCLSLIRNLLRWHRQALLPTLARMDLGLGLPALVIQALLASSNIRTGLSKSFQVVNFWAHFTALLQKYTVIDLYTFQQELACAINGVSAGQANHQRNGKIINASTSVNALQELLACLPVALGAMQADVKITQTTEINSIATNVVKNHHVNLTQDLVQLREWLIAQPKGKKAEEALAILWLRITSDSDSDSGRGYTSQRIAITSWLNRQTNKNQLIMALVAYRHVKSINHWLLAQLPNELNPPEEILKYWHDILLNSGLWQGTSAVLQQQLNNIFWNLIFSGPATADQLLAKMFTLACLRLNISLGECVRGINRDLPPVKKSRWRHVYPLLIAPSVTVDMQQEINRKMLANNAHDNILLSTAYKYISQQPASKLYGPRNIVQQKNGSHFEQDYLAHYLKHPRFAEIVRSLLQQGRLPQGIVSVQAVEVDRLLFDIFTHCPQNLHELIGDLLQYQNVMFRLLNLVPFTWLIDALRKIAPHNESTIALIERFYQSIQQMDLPQLSQQQRLGIYFQLVLKHALNSDWAALVPDKLVSSYCWQLMQQQSLSKTDLHRAFAAHKERMAELLQLALSKVLEKTSAPTADYGTPAILCNLPTQKKLPNVPRPAHRPMPMLVPMKINNAGLVILQSFITPLFSRLGLVNEGKFVTHSARRRAVHYLQYLVTGCCATAEQNLMLNKLLCGLALHEPVEYEIEISPAEQEICHSLLESAIAYWSAIGSSSREGFRGNWLVRDGSLTEAKDRWDLIIDKRAYDLLLARSPFTYSIIKLPWMDKPIYVTWPT